MDPVSRKPLFKRKPSVVIAIGGKPDGEDAMPAKAEALTCPKCGAELADTPENREYAEARAAEAEEPEADESADEEEED